MQNREAAASLFLALVLLLGTPLSAKAGPLRDVIELHRAQRAETTTDAAASAGPVAGVRLLRDRPYGEHPRQRFDIYQPDRPLQGAPILLMVHGGGWSRGDKAMSAVVDNKVARWVPQGVILVSTNYRLQPDAAPVEQARDVARALAAVQKAAAGWGGDGSRVVLMGHSAGAHLVSLLAAAPELAEEVGARPWLGTVALDSAGFDVETIMLAKHARLYDTAFGKDRDYWRQASPLHRLRVAGVPLLAVCSTQRPDKPCVQAQSFADKARGLGMVVEVQGQPLSHRDINQSLGLASAYTTAVESFLGRLDPAFQRVLTAEPLRR